MYDRFDKNSLKLTPYLGMLERPANGCFVFNQTYFSPVKIEGEMDKVHNFFKQIKHNGVKHLKSDLRNVLLQSRILVTKEDKSTPADRWSKSKWETAWKQEPFIIKLENGIESKLFLKHLKGWLSHFECLFFPNRINTLTVTEVVSHLSISQILSRCDELYKALWTSKRPFMLNWIIDTSLEWFQSHMAEFKAIESPNIHFATGLQNELKNAELKALIALLNEGFCPHLTIEIYSLATAERIFRQLERGLGKDGFIYDFKMEKDVACTLPTTEISDFVHHCHCCKELLLRQSNIYMGLLSRIQRNGINNLFADNDSMGRTLVLDRQERIKSIIDLKGCGQFSWRATLTKSMFGGCEYSRGKCSSCPVRYFCGGISKSCLHGIRSFNQQNRMAETICNIKKRVIHQFIEDATAEPQVRLNKKIKLVPAYGTIKIRNIGG
jgi:hypothetical protein